MAKPQPEKKRQPAASAAHRVLPMELPGRRPAHRRDTEWEIIGRAYTTNMGKNAYVRVRRVDQPEITEIRTWSAHERISVTRT